MLQYTPSPLSLQPDQEPSSIPIWWWERDSSFNTAHLVFAHLPSTSAFVPAHHILSAVTHWHLFCVVSLCFILCLLHTLSSWAPPAASTSFHCCFWLWLPIFECTCCYCLLFEPQVPPTPYFSTKTNHSQLFPDTNKHKWPKRFINNTWKQQK